YFSSPPCTGGKVIPRGLNLLWSGDWRHRLLTARAAVVPFPVADVGFTQERRRFGHGSAQALLQVFEYVILIQVVVACQPRQGQRTMVRVVNVLRPLMALHVQP